MDQFNEQPLPYLLDEAPGTAPVTGRQPSYIKDHRQRLRARFMAGGPAGNKVEIIGKRKKINREIKKVKGKR